MGKSTAIVRLIRPANLLTAFADILAGWCIAGAAESRELALLGGASMCLYAGGIALNDVCDAAIDARERPERVIPSGALTRQAALALAVSLLAAGAGFAFVTSLTAGFIASALVGAIALYNAWLKRHPAAGPIAMGACRGLNLLLGMSASAVALQTWWPVAGLHLLYIAGVTATSRHEHAPRGARIGPIFGAAALTFTLVGWLAIAFFSGVIDAFWMATFLLAFAMLAAPPLFRAVKSPIQANVRNAVAAGILGLVVLDASIAAGFASVVYGLITFALLPLGLLLRRLVAVT